MTKPRKHTTPDPVPTGLWVVTQTKEGAKTVISETPYHDRYAAQRYLTAAVRAYAAMGWALVSGNLDVATMVSDGARDVLRVEREMMG